ncbi:MAG: hypothetical protein IIY78_10365 [Clostridia bacterium]|nr:hypothetical protein [Clostridia bacterium]
MSDAVIVGLITAGAAIICQVILAMSGRAALRRDNAENQRLITYRLEQLERKVTAHNNVIERTYKLERDAEIIKEKLSNANQRIDDLEKKP